jgi:hypothetical protein
MNRPFGPILLAFFFILYGLIAITNVQIQFAPVLLGFLALIGGILWLIGR